MNLNWLAQPFAQDAILGAGLLASLSLWVATKLELSATAKTVRALRGATEREIGDLCAKLAQLQATPEASPCVPAAVAVRGLNLTNRTKALRMYGRGEPVATIAAALQVQREEVELLLKLDEMLNTTAHQTL